MLFSLIVPVYNVEKYIKNCLESIINQSYGEFECLIVDDGTKDRSIEIVKEVIKGDTRFKIFHKPNGGLADARNYGLARAKGSYVWFIDSDDMINQNALELLSLEISKSKSDIICFDMRYIYEDSTKSSISKGANFKEANFSTNKDILNIDNSANSKIYKYEFIKDKKFVKGIYYEDLATILVWLSNASKITYLEKDLYYYLQRAGSITTKVDERIFDIYKALDIVKKELSSYEVSDYINQRYLDDCLLMTILRIKNYEKFDDRIRYYKKNYELLKTKLPNWYYLVLKAKRFSFKQKLLFTLYKFRMLKVMDGLLKR